MQKEACEGFDFLLLSRVLSIYIPRGSCVPRVCCRT
ncbi:Cd200 antigen, isoform CRA_c [Rattus norvegicus]|uniref:Cd200 antigen, isoform CRA_c n=1 Tax=Rattus norvegicus TaxID=10116 RepID=A6IQZ0_RAT|nr:Cd200 antigen, isoform CRA_c [Rattus norvegicus]